MNSNLKYMIFAGIGVELFLSSWALMYVGSEVDKYYGWQQQGWGVLAGLFIALIAWLIHVIHLLNRLEKNSNTSKNEKKEK